MQKSTLVKLGIRKEKKLSYPESAWLSGNETKERFTMSNSINNQINIPQIHETGSVGDRMI